MHSTLPPEIEEFRQTCRRTAEKHFRPLIDQMDQRYEFPQEVRPVLAELGAYGLPYPVEIGGGGASWLAWAIVHEESARVLPAVVGHAGVNTIVAGTILDAGTEEQVQRWVPPLLRGEVTGFFAFTEPDTGSDPSMLRTRATRTTSGWRIDGHKAWITNARYADIGVVFAKDPDGDVSLFLVPNADERVSAAAPTKMLGLRGTGLADLHLDGVEVPEDHLLGTSGGQFKTLKRSMTTGKLALAAQSVGIMQAALEEAVRYARQREQQGHPIIDFQAIRHLIAEMVSRIEASRQMLYWAATCKDERGSDTIFEVSSTKLFVTQTAVDVVRMGLNVHGVYGISEDTPIERMFRDAKMYELLEGSSEVQREIVGRAVHDIK